MMTHTLRARLLPAFFLVISAMSLLIAILGYYVVKKDIIDRAQAQVRGDLNFAREVFRHEISSIEDKIRFTASRLTVRDAVMLSQVDAIAAQLAEIRKAEELDVLTLVDKDGRVLVRSRNPAATGDEQRQDEIVRRALAEKRAFSGAALAAREELLTEGADLAEQAYIALVDTPLAKPTTETEQTAGMMIKAAAPVLDRQGNTIAVLYGGTLLNRNYAIVDRVKRIVYQDAVYKGKDTGTVTIFQQDVRISTNVTDADGRRAIGTRVSEEVYDQVLVNGKPWVNKAFVVNDWYKTCYEPIRDIDGRIIGMLYVGTLKRPFTDIARNTMLIFLAIIVGAMLLAVALSVILAAHISKPLTHLIDATAKLARGKLGHRIETETGVKELNELALSFNEMGEQLEERDNNLKLSNEMLEDLNKRYIDLIGFVSHELKGIVGTIIMNVCSVCDGLLGEINEKQKKALDGATRSLDYLTATVKKFLSLGKIEKGELEVKGAKLRVRKEVFEVVVNSLTALAARRNMAIDNRIDAGLTIDADPELLQIAANNLVGNAIKYGRDGGDIVLTSRETDGRMQIEVYNDSDPIREQDKEKLFKRFSRLENAATRGVKGTGLGLFITRQIIEKHGGRIWAEPRQNGNSFIFELPVEQCLTKEHVYV